MATAQQASLSHPRQPELSAGASQMRHAVYRASQAALQRAGASHVLMRAVLIATLQPYTRFNVTARSGGLVLTVIGPTGEHQAHDIAIPGLIGIPSLKEIAAFLNELGTDAFTGRRGLFAPYGISPVADHPDQATEWVMCSARLSHSAKGEVLHLHVPLVLRYFPNGRIDSFRPVPPRSRDAIALETWREF